MLVSLGVIVCDTLLDDVWLDEPVTLGVCDRVPDSDGVCDRDCERDVD